MIEIKIGDWIEIVDKKKYCEIANHNIESICTTKTQITEEHPKVSGWFVARPSFFRGADCMDINFGHDDLMEMIEASALIHTAGDGPLHQESITKNTTNAICHQCKKPTQPLFGQQRYCPECER